MGWRRGIGGQRHGIELGLAVDEHIPAGDNTFAYMEAFERFPEGISRPAKFHGSLLVGAGGFLNIDAWGGAGP